MSSVQSVRTDSVRSSVSKQGSLHQQKGPLIQKKASDQISTDKSHSDDIEAKDIPNGRVKLSLSNALGKQDGSDSAQKGSPFLSKKYAGQELPLNIDNKSDVVSAQDLMMLQMRMNRMLTGIVSAAEMGIGSYQLSQARKDTPLNTFSQFLHPHDAGKYINSLTSGNNPLITPQQRQALKDVYRTSAGAHGIATLTAGSVGIFRLLTGIYETQRDVRFMNFKRASNNKRSEILTKLYQLRGKDLTEERKKEQETYIKQLKTLTEHEQKRLSSVTKSRTICNDINVGANFVSGAGGILSGAGLMKVAMSKQAIAAATTAFTGHHVSSKTVNAIRAASGLLGLGIGTGSLFSVGYGAKHVIDRISGNDKKQKTLEQLAKNAASTKIMVGTGQLLSGIGEIVMMATPYGYPVNGALNWGELIMRHKGLFRMDNLFTWVSGAGSVIGGLYSICSGLYQGTVGLQKLKKLQQADPEQAKKLENEQKRSIENANTAAAFTQLVV